MAPRRRLGTAGRVAHVVALGAVCMPCHAWAQAENPPDAGIVPDAAWLAPSPEVDLPEAEPKTALMPDGGAPDAASREAAPDVDGGEDPGEEAKAVSAGQLWGAVIADVDLELPKGVDPETAQQLLSIHVGDRLEAAAIRRAVKRLVLLAKLDDVRVYAVPLASGPDAVRLVVRLVPARVLRELTFAGVEGLNQAALRKRLTITEGNAVDDRSVEIATSELKDALTDEGYPGAQVETRLEATSQPGAVALHFTVKPGLPRLTEKVVVEGELGYPHHELIEVISPSYPRRAARFLGAAGEFLISRAPEAVPLGEDGLGPGEPASQSRVDVAAARLLAWYRSKGHYTATVDPLPIPAGRAGRPVTVTLRIHAGPRWVPSFRGNHVFSSVALIKAMDLPPERHLDAEQASRWEEAIAQTYKNSGYLHVRVSVRAAPGPRKGTRRILVTIREGAFTEIKSVRVTGDPAAGLTERQLQDEAVGAASEGFSADSGILQRLDTRDVAAILGGPDADSWGWPQDMDPRSADNGYVDWPRTLFGRLADEERVYEQQRWEKGARALEDLYKSRGYLQPRVSGPLTRYTMDGQNVDVKYVVTSGVQTLIRSVSFKGNDAVESGTLLEAAQESSSATALELGKPMDLYAVEVARQALEAIYTNQGFPFARVTDDVAYDNSRREADITFLVEEGPLVTIKEVVIRGNSATRTVVIRDQLTVRRGRRFNAAELEESRRKLMGLGLFSSVTMELAPEEAGQERTLVVDVRERYYWNGEALVGISSEQGPRLQGSLGHRNGFGLGMVFSGRARVNWPYPTYYSPFIPVEIRDTLLSRYDGLTLPQSLGERLPKGTSLGGLESVYVPDAVHDPATRLARAAAFTEAEVVLTLGYPRVLYIPTNPGIRTEVIMLRANRYSFSLNKLGVALTGDIKAPPFKYLRASAAPSISAQFNALQCEIQLAGGPDQTGRTCAGDPTRLTARLDNGQLGLGTLRVPITLDGRDNIFKPHAGYLMTGTADVVIGGGRLFEQNTGNSQQVRSTFLRVAGSLTGYLPLTRRMTLALGARGGTIVPIGPQDVDTPAGKLPHYVPLFERFYLGGSDSVRGFNPDGVLASDDPRAKENPRPLVSQGGNGFWNIRSELRVPLQGPVEGGLFLDAGQLVIDWRDIDPSRFSAGIGAGVRVNTPVGPLVLDVGFGFIDGERGLGASDLQRRIVVHPALGYF